jgi:hypothetical protein
VGQPSYHPRISQGVFIISSGSNPSKEMNCESRVSVWGKCGGHCENTRPCHPAGYDHYLAVFLALLLLAARFFGVSISPPLPTFVAVDVAGVLVPFFLGVGALRVAPLVLAAFAVLSTFLGVAFARALAVVGSGVGISSGTADCFPASRADRREGEPRPDMSRVVDSPPPVPNIESSAPPVPTAALVSCWREAPLGCRFFVGVLAVVGLERLSWTDSSGAVT